MTVHWPRKLSRVLTDVASLLPTIDMLVGRGQRGVGLLWKKSTFVCASLDMLTVPVRVRRSSRGGDGPSARGVKITSRFVQKIMGHLQGISQEGALDLTSPGTLWTSGTHWMMAERCNP